MHYYILSLGCIIHLRVFERLGVAPFPALPTTNFSGMTGQPVKIQGACFLRVTHPEHPEERKQDRQALLRLGGERHPLQELLQNLGIILPHFLWIAKADEEENGADDQKSLCPGLMAEEEPRLRRVGGELFIKREWSMVIFQYFPLLLCFFIFRHLPLWTSLQSR